LTDEELEEIWKPVESVINHLKMGYDEAIVMGGAYGKLCAEIKRLRDKE
jgi:hypothetical protein